MKYGPGYGHGLTVLARLVRIMRVQIVMEIEVSISCCRSVVLIRKASVGSLGIGKSKKISAVKTSPNIPIFSPHAISHPDHTQWLPDGQSSGGA
jgi:hypothetical protein